MSGRPSVNSAQALGMVCVSAAWGFVDGLVTGPRPWLALILGTAGMAWIVRGARPRAPWSAALGDGLSVLALQAALMWPLPVLMAHLDDLPAGSAAASLLLEAAGVDAAPDPAGRLLADTSTGALPIALTWEAAALPLLLRLAACVIVMAPRASWGSALSIVALAAALRLAVMVAVIAGGAGAAMLYEPAVTWAGFLPLAWLLPRACPGASLPAEPPRPAAPLRSFAAGALLVAACLAGGAAAGWMPAGDRKPGRVLIDESRSDWEWTSIPFDTALYGQRSLYNYALWRRWLEMHFDTRVSRDPLSRAMLDQTDVLIIKTPTTPYREDELRHVERFVRRGGGLWLIGDHTNLFGMATVLNRLAAPYGVSFEPDDTFPLDHEGEDRFTPPWPVAHPILRGIPSYAFETSCSLRVPWDARHIMLGLRLGSEEADYGHVNFFGDIRLQPGERFGVFTQAAEVRHGRGRVIAFTDSTNFSNFSMLWPGRRELSLHMVDWLNRHDPGRARRTALGLGAVLAAAVACLLGLPRGLARAAWLWLGCAVFAATAGGAAALSHSGAGEVVPRAPVGTVAFDTEVSDFEPAPASPVMSRRAPAWSDFNAFYIDAARSGLWPVLAPRLDEALRGHGAVVLLHPAAPPSPARLARVRAFLRRGGRMLVVDSARHRAGAAHAWVAPFGLRVSHRLEPVRGPAGPRVPAVDVAAADDAAVVRSTPGGATLAWRDVGPGRVVLLADGALFSDRARGGVYVPVDEAQRGIHASQHEAMRLLSPPDAAR